MQVRHVRILGSAFKHQPRSCSASRRGCAGLSSFPVLQRRCFCSAPTVVRLAPQPPPLTPSSPQRPRPTAASLPPDGLGDIALTIRAVLRQHGPLPLSKLSTLLDDDTMEQVSAQRGGLAGLVSSGLPSPSGQRQFELVTLPQGLKILFSLEFFNGIAAADCPLVIWVTALLIAMRYFPRCGLLPSQQPTSSEVFTNVKRNAPAPVVRSGGIPDTLSAFEDWVARNDQTFVMMGKRIVLAWGGTRQEKQEAIAAALNPFRGGPKGSAAGASQLHTRERDAKALQKVLSSVVPSTFFVPLRTVADAILPFLPQSGPSAGGDSAAERIADIEKLFADLLPSGFLDVYAAAPTLDRVFLRVVDPQSMPDAVVEAMLPDEQLADRFAVFSAGEAVARELSRARKDSPAEQDRQARGMTMSQLRDTLSKETRAKIESLRSTSDDADAGFDVYLLVVDRFRHLFDVDRQRGVARPWSVLPASAQPSSLTREACPLPLVLRHMQSVLRGETLSPEGLFHKLPMLLLRQLMAAYRGPRWLSVPAEELSTPRAVETGSRCLREFITQHSLYFTLRRSFASGNVPSEEFVYSTEFLAAAAASERSGRPTWAGAGSYTDAQKAEMIYNLLPTDQPVSWTCFCNSPVVRALPFPAFSLKQDFFKRNFSHFRLYQPLGATTLIVGRSDGTPPPPETLQPPVYSTDAMLKLLALHAVGGTTESQVVQALSREGRAALKAIGTLTALAEQLPEWFEVRCDAFNPGSNIITYVGPGIPTLTEEDARYRPATPLRMVRNDASCNLPAEGTAASAEGDEAYMKWDPDWDE